MTYSNQIVQVRDGGREGKMGGRKEPKGSQPSVLVMNQCLSNFSRHTNH